MNVIVSAAVSCDGCMDDLSPRRLVLSNAGDWAEVHRLRACCDAILVGAETVRRDNPSLVIRDGELRSWRQSHGMAPDILKVVVSGSGNLVGGLRFFTEGSEARKVVITLHGAGERAAMPLASVAQVVALPEITARSIVAALEHIGVRRLLVEGGARILDMFLKEDMVDRMRLAVSPVRVDEEDAPHLPCFGALPFEGRCLSRRIVRLGDMTVYDYAVRGDDALSDDDRRRLLRAVEVSRNSEPCGTAYRVGCVVAVADGREFEGYTHETDARNHAEEEAVAKALAAGASLVGAAVYSSMEPCSRRSSKPVSCSELLIAHGVGRVVYACAEPDRFVVCEGTERLVRAGIEVVAANRYAGLVREVNAHLLG